MTRLPSPAVFPGVSRRLSRGYSRLLPAIIDSSEEPEALYQIHSLSANA